MSESYMARLGARLVDNGYPVLPIMPGTKKPGLFKGGAWRDYPGWTKHGTRPTSDHELTVWSGWPDAGDRHPDRHRDRRRHRHQGRRGAREPARAAGPRDARRHAARSGSACAPKRLLVYRAAEPLAGMKAHPIEVLGLGQQFVAFADHPDTGRPYDWPQELAGRSAGRDPAAGRRGHDPRLPRSGTGAGAAGAQAWPAAGWLQSAHCRGRPWRSARHARGDRRCAPVHPQRRPRLRQLGPDRPGAQGRARRGRLVISSPPGPPPPARTCPEFTLKTWAGLKPERIGAGTIYHHALAGGWKPGPGAGAERRHPGQRPAPRTRPAGAAAGAGGQQRGPAAPPPPQRQPSTRACSSSTARSSSSSTTSWRAPCGRSRSSPSAPACARWARSWAGSTGPRPTCAPTSTWSAWPAAAAARTTPAAPSRRRSSPPGCSATSAATASPPARACSRRSTASPRACSSSTSSASSWATSSTSAMRPSTSPRSGTC